MEATLLTPTGVACSMVLRRECAELMGQRGPASAKRAPDLSPLLAGHRRSPFPPIVQPNPRLANNPPPPAQSLPAPPLPKLLQSLKGSTLTRPTFCSARQERRSDECVE